MSFKFRKRLRIFPGFTLNLSKSGLSATVGMRGLNVNIGSRSKHLNVGIPGTGIYDRVRLNDGEKRVSPESDISPTPDLDSPEPIEVPLEANEIKSFKPDQLTSESFFGLKESIINAEKDKRELHAESLQAMSKTNSARTNCYYPKSSLSVFL